MSVRQTLARRSPRWLRAMVASRPASASWWEDRLWNGFSTSALSELRERAASRMPVRRWRARVVLARFAIATADAELLATLPAWARGVGRRTAERAVLRHRAHPQTGISMTAPAATGATTHVDVVLMSHFGLRGGTTSSNIQEIEAQARAGITTGLVHHPVWQWRVSDPVSNRVLDTVDGDRVRFIEAHERITCDLLVIRAPKIGERLMDDLPHIEARHTVVIVNQTPMYYYGPDGAEGQAYDLALSAEHLHAAFGDVTWYPIGPRVRAALEEFHGGELPDGALAPTDWLNIIDVEAWQRESRREPDGTTRIGRHSRDDVVKWPETAPMLAAAYPSSAPYQVRVLGGAESAREVLGKLPPTWTVHPFGSLEPREFLHGLDAFVYFTASTYTEAFGRAPLEALAVGLPTVLPHEFEELFGDGALYCAPAEVRSTIDALMANSDRYDAQVAAARSVVRERFGYEAHMARLDKYGVRVQ